MIGRVISPVMEITRAGGPLEKLFPIEQFIAGGCVLAFVFINSHLKHAEFIPKSQNLKIISIPSKHHSRPNQARGNTETEEREDRMVVFSLEEYKPLLAMVATQSVYAVMNLLAKAALQQGFSNFVFVVYRQSIATLALLPALFFTRGRGITGTSLSFKGCCLIFLAALFGGTGNKVLQYVGLNLGTASLVAVMSNLIPATTFVMAASVGLENVEVKSLRTWAKILGTIVCVGGTMILTFYKGPTILKFSDGSLNLGTALHSVDLGTAFHSVDYKWVLAVGCLLVSTSCWSLWLILQGIFGSAVCFYLQSWCVSVRGPVYCAMFMPLHTIITVILAAITLHEELHIGSLIGAVGIIGGLYIVLWGKAEDVKGEAEEPTPIVDASEINISIDDNDDHNEHIIRQPLLVNNTR
ncbi:WAT1-related protein [Rhynchospora pubera]|uniref:WAT1-related protein n=1 Tax=Rhynchospora pubera TaxID=906938 RepID=A0AAV8D3T6_9POAL|nr:WAT1-related protein [Rhynchospora pubera]